MRTLVVALLCVLSLPVFAESDTEKPGFVRPPQGSAEFPKIKPPTQEEIAEDKRLKGQAIRSGYSFKDMSEAVEGWLEAGYPFKEASLISSVLRFTDFEMDEKELEKQRELFQRILKTMETRSTSKDQFREFLQQNEHKRKDYVHEVYTYTIAGNIQQLEKNKNALKIIPTTFKKARARLNEEIKKQEAWLKNMNAMYAQYLYAEEKGTLAGYGKKKGKKGKRRGKKKNRKKPAVHSSDK